MWIRHGCRISNLRGKRQSKKIWRPLLFSEVLPQFTAGVMVAASRAVFFAPFGSAAIISIVEKVVFGFFPVDRPSEPFTHVPFVLIDGMAVLPNLPFIKIQVGFAAV
jgi:hypothetical protein